MPKKGYKQPQWVIDNRVKHLIGRSVSLETRMKISEAQNGEKGYWFGKKKGKVSEETRQKMIKAQMGNTKKRGFKLSHETRIKMSIAQKAIAKSKSNYKGGIEPENKRIRKSIEYKMWRDAVYERDEYCCQKCKERGGVLHPHHIINFADSADLRFDKDNGITLCKKCHSQFHKMYGQKGNNRHQLNEYLCL